MRRRAISFVIQIESSGRYRVLPNEVLEKVEFVLTGDEQVGGRYAALKGALIDCYGRSNARRNAELIALAKDCLLYTSPSPRDS